MSDKIPCTKEGLVKYIQAYAAASKTGNAVLEGLAGDALARHIDSLTFKEDLEAMQAEPEVQPPTRKSRQTKVRDLSQTKIYLSK